LSFTFFGAKNTSLYFLLVGKAKARICLALTALARPAPHPVGRSSVRTGAFFGQSQTPIPQMRDCFKKSVKRTEDPALRFSQAFLGAGRVYMQRFLVFAAIFLQKRAFY